MPNDGNLYEPVGYSVWLLIGFITLIAAVLIWYGFVIWLTRKKKQRTVENLAAKVPVLPDIPAIQKKYLALIDEVERSYQQGAMKSRAVHQKLSLLLRYFVHETKGLRAYTLTLSDLRHTRYAKLVEAIDSYYVPEFHEVLTGDVPTALATAREVVTTWS